MSLGTLTLFCGKMGSGKSTIASEIAATTNAVLLSEDEWLSALYPNSIKSLDDYIHHSNLLKPQIKKTAQSIMSCGNDVVMDYPANTVGQRKWLQSIYTELNAPHKLYLLDIPDDICLQRIKNRSIKQPQRAGTDTPEMFSTTSKFFSSPTPEEHFNIELVTVE